MSMSPLPKLNEWVAIADGVTSHLSLCKRLIRVDAIRLRATRLEVIHAGKVIARTPPTTAILNLPGRPAQVDWMARN